jgi:hypothetical protein
VVRVGCPPSFQAAAAWVIDELTAASAGLGAVVSYPSSALPGSEAAWALFAGGPGEPRALEDGVVDFGDGVEDIIASAFWHLSRWEERGGARDRHGRFPAAAAMCDPARPAVDALLERFQNAAGLRRREGFALVLTHDVDLPRRWAARGASRRALRELRGAVRHGRAGEAAAQAGGLLAAPWHRARGTDPNWSLDRIREIERAHGGRSTYFLLAGHAHPADGPDPAAYDAVRERLVRDVQDGGDEVGLHPSYTTSEDPARLEAERDRLAELAGPLQSVRFHFLRHDSHRDLPVLDRLGFAVDSSHGFADAPGFRAGFSHPYHPFDLAAGRPLGLLEVPLAVMDATLQDSRYLGLSASAGLARALDVLERVADSGGTAAVLWHPDRFGRPYAQGWDVAYEELLIWCKERGGDMIACADVAARYSTQR